MATTDCNRAGSEGSAKLSESALASPQVPHSVAAVQATATIASDQTYRAADYKARANLLTASDIALIRAELGKVKLCQRPFVRYAFPDGYGKMVLFFEGPPDTLAHVFGAGNVYYLPSKNEVLVPPPDATNIDSKQAILLGARWDSQHFHCSSSAR